MKRIPFVAACLIPMALLHAAPPANDSFLSPTLLEGEDLTVHGTTIGATDQPGQPSAGVQYSTWWRWTAPGPGFVTIDTHESPYNTALAVFLGTTLDGLTLVAANDDDLSVGVRTSRVRFRTAPGASYAIDVGAPAGPLGPGGDYVLHLHWEEDAGLVPVPGVDRFSDRLALTGTNAIGVAHNGIATRQPGEPTLGNGRTLWWRWTAPSDGTVQIDTSGSEAACRLDVFVGSELPSLDLVAANASYHGEDYSKVAFQARAGTEYAIRTAVGIGFDSIGQVQLQLKHAPNSLPGGVPGMDSFGRRQDLVGSDAVGVANNLLATVQPGESLAIPLTMWWTWTAPDDGPVTITTAGSDFNTYLVVCRGQFVDQLVRVRENNDFGNDTTSRVEIPARRGETYQIAVGHGGGLNAFPGNIVLTLHQESAGTGALRLRPAFEVEYRTTPGVRQQLMRSIDLQTWVPTEPPVVGTGEWRSVLVPSLDGAHSFYRVMEAP